MGNKMNKQVFSIWVKNKLGVLSKVASAFGTTEANIHSLAVGNTENSENSRISSFHISIVNSNL